MNTTTRIQFDYDRKSLATAVRDSGVVSGDILFCHSNIGFFGRPDCEMTPAGLGQMVINAVLDVIGDEGTFVVPTFSYSFAKGEDFEPAKTPSVCGMLTDYVMRHPNAVRSHHPDFSVTAIGARAEELTENVPANAFGADSFFGRFERMNGKICNFNFDAGSTFAHYVERTLNVPYRYDKKFFGNIIVDGVSTPSHSINFVHDLNEPALAAVFEPFHERAVETTVANVVPVGRGNVCTLSARGVRDLIEATIQDEPLFLTAAHDADEPPRLMPDHSMPERKAPMLDALNPVGLTIDSDYAFQFLADLLPVKIYEVPTGARLGDVIVPERWQLLNAKIMTSDGENILSDQNDAVAVHSRSFSGTINGADLIAGTIDTDIGGCILSGGWKINSCALQYEIDPGDTYHLDITVRNTFSSMRYAILPATGDAADKPAFINLSGDAEAVTRTIRMLASKCDALSGPVLFYVHPFDPDAIYAEHLAMAAGATE